MIMLPFPTDPTGSQAAVLDLVAKALSKGLTPNLRVVLARDPSDATGLWWPACGRFDLTRPGDLAPADCRPIGPVRIIEERLDGGAFLDQLRRAFTGAPFQLAGHEIGGHGMDSGWSAFRHTHDWAEYAPWPCVVATPQKRIERRPRIWQLIEDEGPNGAFSDLEALVYAVMDFRCTPGPGTDVRFERFQLLVWDYRGRIDRFELSGNKVFVEVSPKADPGLKLLGIVSGQGEKRSIGEVSPGTLTVELERPIRRAKFALKSGDEVVSEIDRNPPQELLTTQLTMPRWAVLPEVDKQPEADAIDAVGDSIAGAALIDANEILGRLAFLGEARLKAIVERDVWELEQALQSCLCKASLILCGSLLEAVLLDVLGRRADLAGSYLGKHAKWPSDASLKQLVQIAGSVELTDAQGRRAHLLSQSALGTCNAIMDHRDLVHPNAEVRGEVKVNADVVVAMAGLLRLVVRELSEAAANGVIEAYEKV